MKDSKFIHPQKCNGSVLEETNSITISIDKYLTDELVIENCRGAVAYG